MGVTAWNKGLNGIAYIKAKLLVPFFGPGVAVSGGPRMAINAVFWP